jgi:hypothetical protein
VSDTWDKPSDIPYAEIAGRLFATTGRQEMVPFLGAGVSVSAREGGPRPEAPGFPDAGTMSAVCNLLGLPETASEARTFLEYAVRTALWMHAMRGATDVKAPQGPISNRLRDENYPPYAWELSQLLSERAAYTLFQDRPLDCLRERTLLPENRVAGVPRLVDMVKLLAEVTGVGNSCDPLASIAEFLEHKTERDSLLSALAEVFANKRVPTPTHELVARAAKHHFSQKYPEDYLVITTNYDALMEKAFDAQNLPYVVITVDRQERKAHARFANVPEDELKALRERNPPVGARGFQLNKGPRSWVILFKMHGCLNPDFSAPDGVVITEADYVNFISHLEESLPAVVGALLPGKRLLFLGYSFGDWNVRSVYESIARRANERIRDYAVTKSLSRFEQLYFKERNIGLVLQDLKAFTAGLAELAPTPAAPTPAAPTS